MNVAVNGFGRIGRMVFRAGLNDKKINFVAINDLTENETLAALLQRDSVHGTLKESVKATNSGLIVGKKKIPVFSEKDPSKLPWKRLKVDVVIESTGFFTDPCKAQAHINAGAKKVLISAPCKCREENCNPFYTIVLGVNEIGYNRKVRIISNASCTTNCSAPILKVINDALGIQKAFLTTTHAYTSTQKLIDGPSKDLRRARAAAVNIIPTSTGAAKSVEEVIPKLKGKIDAMALRVPVPNGSITDFSIITKKKTTAQEVNNIFKKACRKEFKGIIEYNEEPIVSSDIIGNPHSAIFDAPFTKANENFIKVTAWYDNEWGYSCRMIDVAKIL